MAWFDEYFKRGLNKKAVDKLSEDELNGQFPPFTDGPGAPPPTDPTAGGMPPQPPPDPSMGMPEEPLVWDNKYLVNPIPGGPQFIVELSPSIVTKPMTGMPGLTPAPPTDPMADATLNPDADPNGLSQWMNQQNDGQDKPFGTPQDKSTEDPLSRQEDGLPPVQDVGNEQSLSPKVDVHRKKASPDNPDGPIKTPGADRSSAYMPCAACANYIAADNECAQGLDVEKVQAAKSCAWLNSNFSPFNVDKPGNPDQSHQDKDTVKNDISDTPGGSGGGAGSSGGSSRFAERKKNLSDYLKKMW